MKDEKDEWKSGVVGLHLNMMGLRPGIDLRKAKLSADEKAWLAKVQGERDEKTAYQRIQATRPQTLGVALTDSPVGLAAWIVEKFQAWSDCGGDPLKRFSMDLLLDNIMVYWLTGTAGTATWLYRGVTEQQSRAPARGPAGRDADRLRRLPGRPRPAAAQGMDRARLQPAPPHGRCPRAGTSRRWRSPTCWSTTSAPSSGRCASARPTTSTSEYLRPEVYRTISRHIYDGEERMLRHAG